MTPADEGLGLAGLALGQERRGLSRMDLVGRWHVEGSQPMDFVAPIAGAGEPSDGCRHIDIGVSGRDTIGVT